MALTFDSLYDNYTDHVGDTTAANVTIGKNRINDTHKELLAMHDYYFAETSQNFTTGASDNTYDLPYNFGKMIAVTIRVGDTTYSLEEVPSHDKWQQLHTFRATETDDIPIAYHITGDRMEIFPFPTAAGTADYGTFYYVKRVVDMQYDDYTTGTVTLTNASAVVTGASTTFTAAMVGRYIKGNLDARWYELSTFTSTTVMGLKKTFQGTTASALAYTIGEMPLIPEEYHNLLYYQPVAQYWMLKKETDQAAYYQALYDKGKKEFFNQYANRTRSQIITGRESRPNRSLTAYGSNRWDEPPLLWDQNNEW